MKYDKTVVLQALDGSPIQELGKDLTFGHVLISGLTMEIPADPRDPTARPLTGQEKNQRFLLALRIQQAEKEFELSIEDAAIVKKAISIFTPVYVGRCYALLDNPAA